jgi:hypothetical protein
VLRKGNNYSRATKFQKFKLLPAYRLSDTGYWCADVNVISLEVEGRRAIKASEPDIEIQAGAEQSGMNAVSMRVSREEWPMSVTGGEKSA